MSIPVLSAHVAEYPALKRGGSSVYLAILETPEGPHVVYGGPDAGLAHIATEALREVDLITLDSVWTEEEHFTFVDFDGRRASAPAGVHCVLGSFIDGDMVVAIVLEHGLDEVAAAHRCGAYRPGARAIRTGRDVAWTEPKDLDAFAC